MADPFAIAASAITVAEFLFKTYETLSKFVRDAKNSDSTAAEVRLKVQQLRAVVLSIKGALLYRTTHVATRPPGKEEVLIWFRIRAALEGCQQNLKRFEEELKGLHGRTQVEWLRKALLQLRLQQKDPTITRFERSMDTHIQVLQTLLLCLQAFAQGDIAELRNAIQRISSFAAKQREEVQSRKERQQSYQKLPDQNGATSVDARTEDYGSEVTADETQNLQTLRKTIRVARTVVDKVSDCGSENWSMPGTDSEMDSDDERLDAADATTIGGPDDDPTPDFNDFTALEVLDPLIGNLERRVDKDVASGRYIEAEKSQLRRIKYLKEREAAYTISFDLAGEQEKLANIYYKQEKFADGNKIIHTLLNRRLKEASEPTHKGTAISLEEEEDLDTRLRRARHFYVLANSSFMQYRSNGHTLLLERSEKFAKRSFKLRLAARHKENQMFLQSVQLLIKIHREQGHSVEVETYSALYLNDNLNPLPSSPSATSPSNAPLTESQQIPSPIISITAPPLDQAHDPTTTSRDEDIRRLRHLVKNVADVKKHNQGRTLLMEAVECGDEEAVRSFLDEGAQFEDMDEDGQPVLHQAIKRGNLGMTELLLDLGAPIEGQNITKATPLLYAVQNGHGSIVRMLLDKGADVSARDKENWTCLHHAVHGPAWDDTQIIEQLVKSRADVNARCTRETPLHMAVKQGKKMVTMMLLEKNADINAKDGAGDTAFHIAVSQGNCEFVELLLDRGATYVGTKLPEMSPRIKKLLKAKESQRRRSSATDDQRLAPSTRRESADTSTSRSSSSHRSSRSLRSLRPWSLRG